MSAPIKSLGGDMPDLAAPTPQNTPATHAPISLSRPNPMPSIGEVHEPPVMGQDDVQKLIATLNKTSQEPLLDMSKFPSAVQDRIRGLKAIQTEHHRLEAEFQQEVLRLEKEYFQKFCPLYTKRRDIIAGALEPTPEEVELGKAEEESHDDDDKDADKSAPGSANADATGIPKFWLTVLKNCDSFATIITDRDEKALEHLVDIRLEYLDTPGFRIIFDFGDASNDFFSNQILTKTYHYQKDLGYGGSFIYDHAEGDKVVWKDGKDLTTKVEKRTQRNKTTRQTRTVSRTVPVDSFFHFFTVPTIDSADPDNVYDASDIEELLEEDYQRGELLKEQIIPRAIDWLTGKALMYAASFGDVDDDELSDDTGNEGTDSEDEEDDGTKPKQDATDCKQS